MNYKVKVSPLSERQVVINQRIENSTNATHKVHDFRSGDFDAPVIKLSIDTLVYRMENCRTFTDQQTEIATKGLDSEFFAKGQESSSAQTAQHEILVKLSKKKTSSSSTSTIVDVLKKEKQRRPVLISSSGVVVDGNRRLAAMRELSFNDDGSENSDFTHVICAVLPADTTTDEIDDIEAVEQARPQTKLDYDWIGDAKLVRRQVNKGRSTKQVADQLRRNKSEIENLLQALDEADLYLNEWVEKPGQYALVSDDAEQIFSDLPKKISNKESSLQNLSRTIAWSLLENREKLPGRLYSFNAAFGKLAPNVADIMREQLAFEDMLPETNEINDADDDGFEVDFGDDNSTLSDYDAVIKTLKDEETKSEAVDILINACETAIEREKGLQSEKAAIKALTQANSKLTGIDVDSAGKSTLPGMLKQITAIKNVLSKIEEKIVKRQADSEKKPDNKV